ncbi:hypothetical protein EDD18DRAFT_1356122 [Armillaria luteobubalina]|uniref:Uncharacterized protein n=1 Tax=Armillaria luteobubalina TaxID=153913 RepID=A0AA39Q137_9AGAR|nr:hypothetical protein EDD18DRAFT_1356122 [Armillaria luteobubalina]
MQFKIFNNFRALLGVRGISTSLSNSSQGYTPRGPQSPTIKGSETNGGGTVGDPKGGSGGQTHTVKGSTGNNK